MKLVLSTKMARKMDLCTVQDSTGMLPTEFQLGAFDVQNRHEGQIHRSKE